MSGARFTPRKGPSSLYVAEDVETATREGLQVTVGTMVKPPAGVTRAVYTVKVELTDVIDLRDKSVCALLGTRRSRMRCGRTRLRPILLPCGDEVV